jgi:lipopolysaccharide/colanic/teichoic acid biosynthesis glycosyltransferase
MQETTRRTWIGGFIRKIGLDEIPQFVNVLTGSMSIVGPRPFIVSESDIADPFYARRYEVRPGITGLWQVSGRNNLTAEELRQLDYLYVSAWAMWWDIKICFDTPRAMLRGLGAY